MSWFHIAVMAMLSMLAEAIVVVGWCPLYQSL